MQFGKAWFPAGYPAKANERMWRFLHTLARGNERTWQLFHTLENGGGEERTRRFSD